jgi:hypothetical protein
MSLKLSTLQPGHRRTPLDDIVDRFWIVSG